MFYHHGKRVTIERDDGGHLVMVKFVGGRIQWVPRQILTTEITRPDIPEWRKAAAKLLEGINSLDELQRLADANNIDINVHKYSIGMAKMQLANKLKGVIK